VYVRWFTLSVSAVLALTSVAPGKAGLPPESDVKFVPRQLLVKVQLGVEVSSQETDVVSNNPALSAALGQVQARSVKELFPYDRQGTQLSRTYLIDLGERTDVLAAATALAKLECVEFAEPNYLARICKVPSDASFDLQWGLQKIQSPPAWDIFTGADNVVVAVVDTGVDREHPDLADNMWVNEDEIPNNGIDDDNNGYIDDYYGWDFVDEDNNPGVDETDPFPIDPHGTHVAGIIGGVADNQLGDTNIVGTMWQCKVMAVRSGSPFGSLTDSDVAMGIRYAVDNGAEVINMSFGGWGSSGIVQAAIRYAARREVVLCAAAGNDDWDWETYPAAFPEVIAVAATDQDDKKSVWEAFFSGSNYGDWITVSAPGSSILSTVLNNGYEFWDGTSMACPFVTGLSGLILGYARSMIPAAFLTRAQVEIVLTENTDDINALNPDFVGQLGTGRINARKALEFVRDGVPATLASISIESDSSSSNPTAKTADISVTEYTSHQFRAIGHYSDGTSKDITDQVNWWARPIRYGKFDPLKKGKFNASIVPADREVVLTTYVVDFATLFQTERVVTIKNDPKVAPVAIDGPAQVDPSSSTSYQARLIAPDGSERNVTDQVRWDVIAGANHAAFDPGRPGVVITTADSEGQSFTIRATFADNDENISYQQTKEIRISPTVRQIAGLYLTGPRQIAAGAAIQLTATLFYSGEEQTEDVTDISTWSVAPAAAGELIAPGRFLAANVTTETASTITVQYTVSGRVYQAKITVNVIPAVPQGETIGPNNPDQNQNTKPSPTTLSDLCSLPGVLIIAAILLAGALCGARLVQRK